MARTLNLNEELDLIDEHSLSNGYSSASSTISAASKSLTNGYHNHHHHYSYGDGASTQTLRADDTTSAATTNGINYRHLNSSSHTNEPIASEKIEKLNYKYKSQLPTETAYSNNSYYANNYGSTNNNNNNNSSSNSIKSKAIELKRNDSITALTTIAQPEIENSLSP